MGFKKSGVWLNYGLHLVVCDGNFRAEKDDKKAVPFNFGGILGGIEKNTQKISGVILSR